MCLFHKKINIHQYFRQKWLRKIFQKRHYTLRGKSPQHFCSLSNGNVLLLGWRVKRSMKKKWKYINWRVADIMEKKAMAPHSSTLAWKITWTEEPGRLPSMESWRVGHDWATSLSLFTFLHWRRQWQPTPVFLPGESHGQRSLVGCRLWGHTESDMTEAT